MFRIDFGWYMLENVKGLFLSVLLRAWAWACVCSLDLYIHSSILVYVGLFLRLCVCQFWLAYAGSCLRTWALTRVHKTPGRGLTLPIFTSFSTVSLLYAILTPFFVIFAPKHHYILLFLFFIYILVSKTSFFIIFAWIKNLMLFSSFAVLIPFCWKGKHWQGGGVVQPYCSRNQALHLGIGLRAYLWPFAKKVCKHYLGAMPHWEVVGYYSYLLYCRAGYDGDFLWLLPHNWP